MFDASLRLKVKKLDIDLQLKPTVFNKSWDRIKIELTAIKSALHAFLRGVLIGQLRGKHDGSAPLCYRKKPADVSF